MNNIALATMLPAAAVSGTDILSKVVGLLTGGVGFLGGAMVVWASTCTTAPRETVPPSPRASACLSAA